MVVKDSVGFFQDLILPDFNTTSSWCFCLPQRDLGLRILSTNAVQWLLNAGTAVSKGTCLWMFFCIYGASHATGRHQAGCQNVFLDTVSGLETMTLAAGQEKL